MSRVSRAQVFSQSDSIFMKNSSEADRRPRFIHRFPAFSAPEMGAQTVVQPVDNCLWITFPENAGLPILAKKHWNIKSPALWIIFRSACSWILSPRQQIVLFYIYAYYIYGFRLCHSSPSRLFFHQWQKVSINILQFVTICLYFVFSIVFRKKIWYNS